MPAWNYNAAETRRTMARLAQVAEDRRTRWIINHDPQSRNGAPDGAPYLD
jgi:hypothetical protein